MKKLLVVTILLALVVAGIGYWYYHSLGGGPKYSLLQAAYAVQTHDVESFERYVDVESVTDKLVDQLSGQAQTLGLADARAATVLGALQVLKPELRRAAHAEVQHYVKTGVLQTDQRQLGLPSGVSVVGFAGKVLGAGGKFKGIRYVREQGEQALVGLEFTQPAQDSTTVLELKMLDRGDHWQVTEITNTAALVKQLARNQQ